VSARAHEGSVGVHGGPGGGLNTLLGLDDVEAVRARQDEEYFRGWIAELLVFDKTLDRTEHRKMEAYLARKWGVRLRNEMPGRCVGHTYSDNE
jgi:hypothetical protein